MSERTSRRIARHFPKPDGRILLCFVDLQAEPPEAEDGMTPQARAEQLDKFATQQRNLPRPWDPPTCEPELRQVLWLWLDKVVEWINHEYAWQPEQMIPACWPDHPHIAHELAVLACLRWDAGAETTPEGLEAWHRFALPGFLERMASRLDANCRDNKHQDWPALARHKHYSSAETELHRSSRYSRDRRYDADQADDGR